MTTQKRSPATFALMAALAAAGCGSEPRNSAVGSTGEAFSAPVSGCNESAIRAAAPPSAQPFLDRGFTWIHNAVGYCECQMPGSGAYRADCSGFVSYMWDLPAPGNTTYQFPGGDRDNGRAVAIGWSDLTIGDALNFGGSESAGTGHVMLFAGWLDESHDSFCALEESHKGTVAHVSSHALSDAASGWGGSGQFRDAFRPIRKAGYVPTPPPPPEPSIRMFEGGDFDGDGRKDVAFYDKDDGNWWMGLSNGDQIGWHKASNSSGFGDLLDGKHAFYTGDFNGDKKTDILFYFNGDNNWWLGASDGNQLAWSKLSNSAGFGNLLDAGHAIFTGDFTGDGKADVLFYSSDGNWWLGASDGAQLAWHQAAATPAFGNLVDGKHFFYTGDYDGDGKSDILFYFNGDSNWWLGRSNGNQLDWSKVGNTAGFGNLTDAGHAIYTGDFSGDGKTDVLFYSSDGNWWLGASTGTQLAWHQAAATQGFGNLLDGKHVMHVRDFDGDGKTDVLFYSAGDGNWWLGASDGNQLGWTQIDNSSGFGSLVDGHHLVYSGDTTADGKADIIMYSAADSNWWIAVSSGRALSWHQAGNTSGFGSLLR